ncbi:hypothetical protein [Actinomadura nitritigenes]|uniref:hypothetical protein n=1 Tax=Actinomadura nitritigenes TaxID=134602 RepID=UPI003D8C5E14
MGSTIGFVFQLGVDAQGVGELVFQDDDAAGGVQGGAVVEEIANTMGARREVCLDVTPSRANYTHPLLWPCGESNGNQRFVIEDGHIAVEDTLR